MIGSRGRASIPARRNVTNRQRSIAERNAAVEDDRPPGSRDHPTGGRAFLLAEMLRIVSNNQRGYCRSPNIAVPTRTISAPSSMATTKSSDIPMLRRTFSL